jgi:hypothetical protein
MKTGYFPSSSNLNRKEQWFFHPNENKTKQKYRYTLGVDVDPDALQIALHNLALIETVSDPTIDFVQADLASPSFIKIFESRLGSDEDDEPLFDTVVSQLLAIFSLLIGAASVFNQVSFFRGARIWTGYESALRH